MAHPVLARRAPLNRDAGGMNRGRSRRGRRGVTLLETVIVLAFFGAVGSIVTLAVSAKARARAKTALGFGGPTAPAPAPRAEPALGEREISARRAQALRDEALVWRLSGRAAGGCPTVEALVGDLPPDVLASHDAWGNPFELECDDLEIFVTSAGADREPGTADDITEPQDREPSSQSPLGDDAFRRDEYEMRWHSPGQFQWLSGRDPVDPPEAPRAKVSGK